MSSQVAVFGCATAALFFLTITKVDGAPKTLKSGLTELQTKKTFQFNDDNAVPYQATITSPEYVGETTIGQIATIYFTAVKSGSKAGPMNLGGEVHVMTPKGQDDINTKLHLEPNTNEIQPYENTHHPHVRFWDNPSGTKGKPANPQYVDQSNNPMRMSIAKALFSMWLNTESTAPIYSVDRNGQKPSRHL